MVRLFNLNLRRVPQLQSHLYVQRLSFSAMWILMNVHASYQIFAQTVPGAPLDPIKISDDWSKNAVRAEIQYKGKILFLTGRVTSIDSGKNIGIPSQIGRISFESQSSSHGNTWYCGFDVAQKLAMANLEKGDIVILRGQLLSFSTFAHCIVESDTHVQPAKPAILDSAMGFFPATSERTCHFIEAVKIKPRIYSVRVASTSLGGWRPVQWMALDLKVKNIGNRKIDAIWFEIRSKDRGSIRDWDEVPTSMVDGETKNVYFPTKGGYIELYGGYDSATIAVTKVRFADGLIQDLPSCELGRAPLPAPFVPGKADPNSPTVDMTNDISPPRILESPAVTGPPEPAGDIKRATFSLIIGEDGEPRNIKLAEGSLGPVANQREIDTLKRWYFAPAMRDDTPVAVRFTVNVCSGQYNCQARPAN